MEWTKHVAQPIRQVAPRWSLRGLKEDYGESTADVVLLAGEIHLGRKPVIQFHYPDFHSFIRLCRVLSGLQIIMNETTFLVLCCINYIPLIKY